MRTLLAGLQAFQRKPLVVVPMSLEAAIVAAGIAVGSLPARATTAAATAVFPLDVYFDLKHALAVTASWPAFLVALVVSVLVRSIVLYGTLTIVEDGAWSWNGWRVCVRLAVTTMLAFVPVAVLVFAGTAIRYAPFLWIAAPFGLGIAVAATRRAVRLDVGNGAPAATRSPAFGAYLSYVVFVVSAGAALAFLGDRSSLLGSTLFFCLGPLHALVLVGWREHAIEGAHPGGGRWAAALAALLVGAVAVGTFYDRVVRSSGPVARTPGRGTLMLVGGIDSTSESGALTELSTRSLGFSERNVTIASYTDEASYGASHTHRPLDEIAPTIATQIRAARPPVYVVGHSQAALILDRIADDERAAPERSVMFAPAPSFPPRLTLPSPGRAGDGRAGADLTRVLSGLFRLAGREGFDLDGPASPTNLEAVSVIDAGFPRMSIWALADSVWLDRDWRRPGEINLVAVTDHVGVTNNARAISAARAFLVGGTFESDATSWSGALVPVVRYAFEPWRPENR